MTNLTQPPPAIRLISLRSPKSFYSLDMGIDPKEKVYISGEP